jgi:hypothetical protein
MPDLLLQTGHFSFHKKQYFANALVFCPKTNENYLNQHLLHEIPFFIVYAFGEYLITGTIV